MTGANSIARVQQILVNHLQGRLDVLPRFLTVEKVGVNRFEECRIQLQRLRNHFSVGEQRRPRTSIFASESRSKGSRARRSPDLRG